MTPSEPHQNGKLMRLRREDEGPSTWLQSNSIIVNRACTKWLQGRGLSTDRYNLNLGSLYAKKTNNPQQNEQ